MNRYSKSINPPKAQQGIALAISLIFLLLLSIAGVSAIQGTTFEQRMTTNMQNMMHAFHYAESGIAKAVTNPGLISAQLVGANTLQDNLCQNSGGAPIECPDASGGNARTDSLYAGVGKKPPVNFSLDAGFANHYFQVTSTGIAGRASSTHRQGLFIVGPGELQ